ncbi:MAG: serine hydrolase domain-containing protein [Candidatus Promineifilaceae bacterium]
MEAHDNPTELGFSAERLTRITTVTQRFIDEGKLPGFITLVARKGKIAYLHANGLMDIADNRPMQPDTIFRIFSMTKPIASVALLMLFERSLCLLSDPVAKYLPEFADTKVYQDGELVDQINPMTVQNLLTHTAGLSYGGEHSHVDRLYMKAGLWDKTQTIEQFVKKLAALPLKYQPGSKWAYSMATDVVGRLVEVLSGQPLDQFIAENICKPLGMVDTAFVLDPAKADRLMTCYEIKPDNPLAVYDKSADSRWLPPVNCFMGGSGMVSTMADYYRFTQMLLNKGQLDGVRILGRKTVERMRMNHLTPDLMPVAMEFSPPYHGLGFGLGVSAMVDVSQSGIMGSNGDHGWGGYAQTTFWIDPEEEMIVINMTQCIPSGFYPIRQELRTAVYQALVD